MVNKSKAYIAPLVLDNIPELPFNKVLNTFILSDFKPLEPILYVLVPKELENIEELLKQDSVDDIFELDENYLLVINISPKYNYEYLCFKRGNYSWYTPETKSLIVKYLANNVNRKSLYIVDKVRSIFARDPMLKKYYESTLNVSLEENAELGSRIIEEEETFKSINYGKFEQIKR